MEHLGRYELVRKLAKGGMGEVFLARSAGAKGFRKTVVVKRIHPHLAAIDEFVEMFLNEGRLAAMFDHPNVVQIFDLGEADGTYYLAMEYVDGSTLFGLIKSGLKRQLLMPIEIAMKVVAFAMEGLHYAHTFTREDGEPLRLIHRDISPDNLLVARSGAVKVADFGVARATTLPRVTQTGAFKGKVSYLAPEMLRTKNFDHRVDIFSSGVVLFEAITGMKPFPGSSPTEVLEAISREPPREMLEYRPDASPALRELVLRCLSKDPAQRPGTARELQQELDRLLVASGSVVTAGEIAGIVAELVPPTKAEPVPDDDPSTRKTDADGVKPSPKLRPQAHVPLGDTQPAKPLAAPRKRSSAFAQSAADAQPVEEAPASVPPEDQVLSPEEEKAREAKPVKGEKRQVPTSVLIAGFVAIALGVIAYAKLAPKPQVRAAGYRVTDIGDRKLVVDSDPPGAEVWVQNQRLGVTPYSADNDYPFGSKQSITVRMLGMVEVETQFAGGRGQKVWVVLTPPESGE